MVEHPSIRVVRGSGVVGDRWYRSRWTYLFRRLNAAIKRKPFHSTNISIISLGDLARGNAELERLMPGIAAFTPYEMRRNIVLSGDVDLNTLAGKEFSIGSVRLRWSMACTPCGLPTKRAGRGLKQVPAFKKAFGDEVVCWAGIRATILTSGTVRVGDALRTE